MLVTHDFLTFVPAAIQTEVKLIKFNFVFAQAKQSH